MHITNEMKDLAQRNGLCRILGRTLYDGEVRLIGGQNVVCWWVHRLDRGGLALGCVGEVNIMPRAVMERGIATYVVRPAGCQHEEGQILLLRGEVELRQSWHPL